MLLGGPGNTRAKQEREQYSLQEKAHHILASDGIGPSAYLKGLKAKQATGEFAGTIPRNLKKWRVAATRALILKAAAQGTCAHLTHTVFTRHESYNGCGLKSVRLLITVRSSPRITLCYFVRNELRAVLSNFA